MAKKGNAVTATITSIVPISEESGTRHIILTTNRPAIEIKVPLGLSNSSGGVSDTLFGDLFGNDVELNRALKESGMQAGMTWGTWTPKFMRWVSSRLVGKKITLLIQ